MEKLLSQIPLSPGGGFRGQGPLGLEGKDATAGPLVFNTAISTTIGVMTVVAAIWFVFQFIGGAISIIASGGDKQKLAEARQKMFTSIIGIAVVVSALFIIDIVGKLIGLEILRGTLEIPSLIIR